MIESALTLICFLPTRSCSSLIPFLHLCKSEYVCMCCVLFHAQWALFKQFWCPLMTHKSFTCFSHQRHLLSSPPRWSHLRGKESNLSDLPRNVINFLTTAVDLLLRRKEAEGDEPASLSSRNGKRSSISVYKLPLTETQRRAKKR